MKYLFHLKYDNFSNTLFKGNKIIRNCIFYIPTLVICITHGKEFTGNQGKQHNFDTSDLYYIFGLIFMGMKGKKMFLKKIKMAISKKLNFSILSILNIFLLKFQGLVFGLVG